MNWKRSTAIIPLLVLLSALSVPAQTVERVITAFDDGHLLSRPTQLALSPAGSSVAVSDPHSNRIYVFDTDGGLLWTVGDIVPITEPTAVCFDGEDAVLFSIRSQPTIFRAAKATPGAIDTVVDLSSVLPKDAVLDQMLEIKERAHLILDRRRHVVYRLKPSWAMNKELIRSGSRKGELWSPVALATDLSGNIVVADEGNFPVQVFSPDGRFLFFGGWNAPQPERVWSASAIAVTRDERIWVADITNSQWRIFDRTGSQTSQSAFTPPVFHPNALIATPDNRLIMADERGSVIIIRLP